MNKIIYLFLIILCIISGCTFSSDENVGKASSKIVPTWTPLAGPYEGVVTSFAQAGDSTLYAGSLGSGIFKSTDNGGSWVGTTLPACPIIMSLVVGTAPNYSIWAASNDTYCGGVYRSQNGGSTWTKISSGLSGTPMASALLFTPNGDLYVGISGGSGSLGVWKISAANLEIASPTWTSVNTGLSNNKVNTLACNSSGDIFAGTNNGGVFKLLNGSSTWSSTTSLPSSNIKSLLVQADGTVQAGTDNGLYRSVNSGSSWSQDSGLSQKWVWALGQSGSTIYAGTASPQNFGGCSVQVKPCSEKGELYTSVDNGVTFSKVNSSVLSLMSNVRAIVPTTSGLLMGADGAYLASDNVNWVHLVDVGLNVVQNISDLFFDSNGSLFVSSWNSGISASNDNGATWVHLNQGLPSFGVRSIGMDQNGSVIIGLGAGSGSAYKLECGVWVAVPFKNVSGTTYVPTDDVRTFTNRANGALISGTGFSGGAWDFDPVNSVFNQIPGTSTGLLAYSLVVRNDGALFLGSETSGVYYSPSGSGSDWIQIGSLAGMGSTQQNDYSLIFNSSNQLLLGAVSGATSLQKWNGTSWFASDAGMQSYSTVYDMVNDGTGKIFAGTSSGVYRSSDGIGVSWTIYGSGTPASKRVRSMVVRNGIVYAGLGDKKSDMGYGVWSAPVQ